MPDLWLSPPLFREAEGLRERLASVVFILRDLVTDEEIGLNAEGELWLRARRAVDAEACCFEDELD